MLEDCVGVLRHIYPLEHVYVVNVCVWWYCVLCRHCGFQVSSLLSCSLPMTQSNWAAAALIEPKKPKPPWAGGCPAERAGEVEWEQSNKTLSPLYFCYCCLPDFPRSPACSPISTPWAGYFLFPCISLSVCRYLAIFLSLFLPLSSWCCWCTVLMLSSDVCFLVVLFCFCPSSSSSSSSAPFLPSSFLCAGPSGTNIIIGSIAGAILLAAIVLGGTGWGFK